MADLFNGALPGMSADEAFDEELSDDDIGHAESSNKKARRGAAGPKSKSKHAASSSHDVDDGNGSAAAASARKLQNRVAQREFRQRKLQYVKDLEARVEFLSGNKDDQLEALKAMLRGLLEENKHLRTLLQTVSAFVGEGMGGTTHRLGFSNVTDFEEFVNRSDQDTIHRIHEGWKTKYSKQTKVDSGVGQNNGDARMSPASTPDPQQAQGTQSSAMQASDSAAQVGTRKRGRPLDASKEAEAPSAGPASLHAAQPAAKTTTSNIDGTSGSADRPTTVIQSHKAGTTTVPPMPLRIGATTPFAAPPRQYHFATEALLNSSAASATKLVPPQGPSFFFDAHDPINLHDGSATSSPFTADFMAEFSHTGFTPAPTTTDGNLGDYNWPDFAILPTSTPAPYAGLSDPMENVAAATSSQANLTPPAGAAKVDAAIGATASFSASAMSPDAVINSSPLLQAIHLLSYHMRHKAENPAYLLPPSLAPTQTQILIPHDSRIDGIIWPQLRDKLITSNSYDINTVLADLLEAVTVHPSADLLDYSNWELSKPFLQKYQALATSDLLTSTNRWRKSRGESPLAL